VTDAARSAWRASSRASTALTARTSGSIAWRASQPARAAAAEPGEPNHAGVADLVGRRHAGRGDQRGRRAVAQLAGEPPEGMHAASLAARLSRQLCGDGIAA
jgi:hypothetical protein